MPKGGKSSGTTAKAQSLQQQLQQQTAPRQTGYSVIQALLAELLRPVTVLSNAILGFINLRWPRKVYLVRGPALGLTGSAAQASSLGQQHLQEQAQQLGLPGGQDYDVIVDVMMPSAYMMKVNRPPSPKTHALVNIVARLQAVEKEHEKQKKEHEKQKKELKKELDGQRSTNETMKKELEEQQRISKKVEKEQKEQKKELEELRRTIRTMDRARKIKTALRELIMWHLGLDPALVQDDWTLFLDNLSPQQMQTLANKGIPAKLVNVAKHDLAMVLANRAAHEFDVDQVPMLRDAVKQLAAAEQPDLLEALSLVEAFKRQPPLRVTGFSRRAVPEALAQKLPDLQANFVQTEPTNVPAGRSARYAAFLTFSDSADAAAAMRICNEHSDAASS